MIKTFDMRDRDARLELFGPPGFTALFEKVVRPIIGRTRYPLDVIELEPHEEIGFDGFVIQGFPVKHRVEAFGYAFIEDDRPGRFDAETAPEARRHARPRLRPPAARRDRQRRHARAGRWGTTATAAGSSTPATRCRARPPRSTPPTPTCSSTRPRSARTNAPARARPATRTARQAAQLALDADVKLLALTHLSTRYFPREIRDEARAVFENTVVPRDFDAIEIPFPERGEPHLVKRPDSAFTPRQALESASS